MRRHILTAALVLALAGASQAATITLDWADNSTDETGFKIERRLRQDPVGSYKEIGQVAANIKTYDDNTVATNTQYCYRVRGFNPVALSDYSNEACMMLTPSGLIVTFKNP